MGAVSTVVYRWLNSVCIYRSQVASFGNQQAEFVIREFVGKCRKDLCYEEYERRHKRKKGSGKRL